MNQDRTTIGMVMFPDMTQLDFTGPYEIFVRMPGAKVHLLAADMAPVRTQHGLTLLPDTAFADAPPCDILFVPGGSPGVDRMLDDEAFLSFLGARGREARYVTAVCTGALLLGAAGLLDGYRAATHWMNMQFLEPFGAVPTHQRVVIDRNRITGGGVTAGIDVALSIAAELHGRDVAEEIQLFVEYDPQPPFDCGSPRTAAPALMERVQAANAGRQAERAALVGKAAARLRGGRSG